MFNILKDKNGDVSSRIVVLFLVVIFSLSVVILCLLAQKDIPTNATNVLITIIGASVPASLVGQVFQNIKERELERNEDLDGDGKIGE